MYIWPGHSSPNAIAWYICLFIITLSRPTHYRLCCCVSLCVYSSIDLVIILSACITVFLGRCMYFSMFVCSSIAVPKCYSIYRHLIYLSIGYNIKAELLIHKTRSCLGQVPLVRNQTASPKATRTTNLMHPFGPLWIQMSVWLLIFRFENTNFFLQNICKAY